MTASERLEKRLAELKVTAKKSLGQNFLVSDHVIKKIIDAVSDLNSEYVIEVGPGCGALTDILIEKYRNLTLIELDRDFAAFWKDKVPVLIEGDALQIPWNFTAEHILVSNLPYQISSSLVIDRSLDKVPLKGMVLMFQREVAQRIRAPQQSEHYGMLSVIAQEFWHIETVCDAGSREFKPAPKVSSRVLKFSPIQSNIENRESYLKFIKTCFQQRRRILSTNLSGLPSEFKLEKFKTWVEKNKLSEKVRAEELSPRQLNSLYHFLREA